ncbi:MAG: bifunctional diaminohydroxyphosphoribosylaminopyrimidine deaminase/5-amino-6-(5-phosphoribosylamino)uracil reductase RibD [Beijerinckiaceae bacterium]
MTKSSDWLPPNRQAANHDAAMDTHFMRHALALGARGAGRTWPNPAVGAVIVLFEDGGPRVVGTGFTQAGGRPHAEAMAIDAAGLACIGATMYVTLEPCAHRSVRGATPCCERTMVSGVRRVVSAMSDPNPHIAGLGHALLRSFGISVTENILNAEAQRAHRGHVSRVQRGRPMVTVKIARSADNYCAVASGARTQISSDTATRQVHLIRAQHDVIMAGIGTVLADDPMLNVRLPGLESRSPVRVILDSALRLPLPSQIVRSARDIPVWVIATEEASVDKERALVAAGVEVMRVAQMPDGHLNLQAALELLGARGVTRVFSEGGPTVAERLARDRLIDVMIVSTSSRGLNVPGVVAIRDGLQNALADAQQFHISATETFDTDVFVTYERIG